MSDPIELPKHFNFMNERFKKFNKFNEKKK